MIKPSAVRHDFGRPEGDADSQSTDTLMRRLATCGSGLLREPPARRLRSSPVPGLPIRVGQRRVPLLSALSPGAAGVGGRSIAAVGSRAELRRALAGKPNLRRALSWQAPVYRLVLRVGISAVRDCPHGSRLLRHARIGAV